MLLQILAATTLLAPVPTAAGFYWEPVGFTDTVGVLSQGDARPYRRMTLGDYAGRVMGPRALARDFALSAFDQLTHRPREWGKNWDGYHDRLASRLGARAIAQTFVLGVSVFYDERRAYFTTCNCTGRGPRLRHALLTPFRVDTPDGTRLSLVVPASEIAGSLLITSLRPGGFKGGAGLVGGATGLLGSALQSTVREFWPWHWRPPGV